MVQQVINVGAAGDDHTGDPLRSALQKANNNFTDLYVAESLLLGTRGVVLLGSLKNANFNTTADQAIALALPSTLWIPNSIRVVNRSGSLSAAVGGIYTGAGKTGVQVVASSQAYSALASGTPNTAGNMLNLTVNQIVYDASTLFLSLTTPQGAAVAADIYVFGFALP